MCCGYGETSSLFRSPCNPHSARAPCQNSSWELSYRTYAINSHRQAYVQVCALRVGLKGTRKEMACFGGSQFFLKSRIKWRGVKVESVGASASDRESWQGHLGMRRRWSSSYQSCKGDQGRQLSNVSYNTHTHTQKKTNNSLLLPIQRIGTLQTPMTFIP